MKQYLLAAQMACTDPGTDDMKTAGAWVFVGGLRPSHAATVIRPANGAVTMTDGLFAETREQPGRRTAASSAH